MTGARVHQRQEKRRTICGATPSGAPTGKFIYARFSAGFSDPDAYRIDAATGTLENCPARRRSSHHGFLHFAGRHDPLVASIAPAVIATSPGIEVATKTHLWLT